MPLRRRAAILAAILAVALGGLAAPPAPAATITLANHEIVLAGEITEADRVAFAQRVGRWLAATGRGDLILRLDRVHGDPEAAKRILRFLAALVDAGLALSVDVDPRDPCPAACMVLRDGHDDPAFLAGLDGYAGYRIQRGDGTWTLAPSTAPR
jgi:hypothetical protein